MKKLVCSVQTFGFGPVSKLYSVARLLKDDFSLTLLLDSDRNVFHKLNPGIFDEVTVAASVEDIEAIVKDNPPAAILSSYEPNAILAANRAGLSSYFIDGLFWFWELPEGVPALVEHGRKLAEADECNLEGLLSKLTPHERIFASHFLASKSYVQQDLNIGKRLEEIAKFGVRVKNVGAIINNPYQHKQASESHILITLSGETFPTVSVDQSAMYAQLIIGMVSEAAKTYFKDMEWIVLVNPVVKTKLKANYGSNVSVRDSVDQGTMYCLQRDALVVFSSPGLTTIYECASLGKPLVFLPEQNVQYKNAYRLQSYGYPVLGGFFNDICANHEPNTDEYKILATLYRETIPRFLADYSQLFGRVFGFCGGLYNPEYRRDIAEKQRAAVLRMVGNMDGAQQIASDIKREIS